VIADVSRILLQQHYGGTTFFGRTWNEFKAGFGDVTDDYWIGNDRLHALTHDGQYKLRVELLSNGTYMPGIFKPPGYYMQWYWAEYSTFRVGNESTGYRLNIRGYSGTAGDQLSDADGMKFSTRDRDNDIWDYHCAADVMYGNGGGFWYKSCGSVFINSPIRDACGFVWSRSGGYGCTKLLVSRMVLLPIN